MAKKVVVRAIRSAKNEQTAHQWKMDLLLAVYYFVRDWDAAALTTTPVRVEHIVCPSYMIVLVYISATKTQPKSRLSASVQFPDGCLGHRTAEEAIVKSVLGYN